MKVGSGADYFISFNAIVFIRLDLKLALNRALI